MSWVYNSKVRHDFLRIGFLKNRLPAKQAVKSIPYLAIKKQLFSTIFYENTLNLPQNEENHGKNVCFKR